MVEAYVKALEEPRSVGQSYDLIGPDVMTLKQIVKLAARGRSRHRMAVGLPATLGKLQAEVGEWLPGKPISRDNWRSLQLDSVSLEDGLRRLGVTPTPVEPRVAELLQGC